MLIKNLDLSRSLSNGSRGVVKSFSSRGYPIVNFLAPDSNEVEVVPVKFVFFFLRGSDLHCCLSFRFLFLVQFI